MPRVVWYFVLLLCLPIFSNASGGDPPVSLLTKAESSDFRATARHAEVVTLLDRLAAASSLARRGSLGTSGEGRDLPLLILSDPPVENAAQAREQMEKAGKLLVLAIGNIHAGEVDGKEALPMLARDLLLSEDREMLKDLIFAIAPIYNADGNEQVSVDNRPGQKGPAEGMGRRENAAGLDLNRDFIKLEAPETRALVRFFNEWDPHIFVDTHTTNGSYHRYVITYEGPKAPAGDDDLLRYCRDEMMPAINKRMLEKYAVPSFVYGDFNRDHSRWETYPAQGRYGTTYFGLRGRISILSEGYSYAEYKTRVLGTRDFVRSILEYARENRKSIREMLARVDRRAVAAAPAEMARKIALRTEAVAAPRKVPAAGFVEEKQGDRTVATSQPRDYDVELWTHFRATLEVERPFAYVLPANASAAIDKLREHGVSLERLAADVELDVETDGIQSARFANDPFQGHKTVRLETTRSSGKRKLPAGSIIVRCDQRLGNLVAYLLEPRSEDGLITWNFFDEWLKDGGELPVLHIPSKCELATVPISTGSGSR